MAFTYSPFTTPAGAAGPRPPAPLHAGRGHGAARDGADVQAGRLTERVWGHCFLTGLIPDAAGGGVHQAAGSQVRIRGGGAGRS